MSVRIADVARCANVGAGTVSRVLNGSPSVSRQTRAHVEACIQELGYRPNLVARGLAANRTGTVAAVIPTIGYTQHAEVVQGLSDILHEQGVRLMIGHCGYSPEREQQIVADFLERRPDAFYLTGTWHTAETRRLLRGSGIPVVEGANLAGDAIDCMVGYDNFEGARQVVRLLHGRGYGRVAVATSAGDANDRMSDRLRGYVAACEELGLARDGPTRDGPARDGLVLRHENSFAGGAEAVAYLLRQPSPPDLLLCATDVMAVGAVFECQRRGLHVPGRLAVCGFDDLPLAAAINPALTTVRIDRVQMGRTAGAVLLRRLKGDRTGPEVIDVGFQIIERASTRNGPAAAQPAENPHA